MSPSASNRDLGERLERQRSRLRDAGQDQVLRFWNELSASERRGLLDQAEEIDLDLVRALAGGELTFQPSSRGGDRQPAPVLRLEEEPEVGSRREAIERGEELLRRGEVGVFLVAGGQGSRLGYDGPKGCLPSGPLSGRTLFELHAGKIRFLGERFGADIPWYIMTSEQNDAATRDFFRRQEFFGLPPDSVLFLPQAMLPALDAEGRLILESRSRIFCSPNGHGGAFEAFARRGGIDHAEARGVTHLFYFQVDNILIRIADPLFMGLHDLTGSEMSLKVLEKTGPDEKIGVVVLEGGRAKVIEYSDLSREEADRRDERGRLVFWAGSPAIHAFRIDFTRRAASGAVKLPYHVAAKEIPAVDAEGRPCKIQGFKYETFVFDALPEASRFLNLEIVREQEFAPIKNRSGVDSLESARELMVSEHRRWLGEVGIDARGAVEISPLAAAEPGDLAGALAAWNGRTFERDIRVERSREGEIVIEEIAGSAPSNGS